MAAHHISTISPVQIIRVSKGLPTSFIAVDWKIDVRQRPEILDT